MKKLSFYDVNIDYINFLKEEEIKHRGFTRIPNITYENSRRKFLCGIVFTMNNFDYYVPLSSYKKQMSENFIIRFEDDEYNKIKGSLRFNFMIPVPKVSIVERIIKNEQNESRKLFLQKELDYINDNIDTIMNRAKRTYLRVINKYNDNLTKNSCDFKLLEQKCLEYEAYLKSIEEVAVTEEIEIEDDYEDNWDLEL